MKLLGLRLSILEHGKYLWVANGVMSISKRICIFFYFTYFLALIAIFLGYGYDLQLWQFIYYLQ
jgi:hypothetical protein